MKKAQSPKITKKLPKAQVGKQAGKVLSKSDLDALSHQYRGMMNADDRSFVKKSGSIMNELGNLTTGQRKQLEDYMNKASIGKKIYEALPNVGRMIGKSAADISKNSVLQKQKKGGSTYKKVTPVKTVKKVIKKK